MKVTKSRIIDFRKTQLTSTKKKQLFFLSTSDFHFKDNERLYEKTKFPRWKCNGNLMMDQNIDIIDNEPFIDDNSHLSIDKVE